MSPTAAAIQAIAFDQNPATNGTVTWHQDVMFPLAHPVTSSGDDLPAKKTASTALVRRAPGSKPGSLSDFLWTIAIPPTVHAASLPAPI